MQLIAHRGVHSDLELENSDLAIIEAVNLGCKAIEVDLQLTANNEIILFHDFSLQRIFGINKKIRNSTLNELQELSRLTSKKGKIITLFQALQLIPDCITLNIELKSNSIFRSYKLAYYVIQQLIETKRTNIIISSFNPFILYTCCKIAPNIQRAILINRKIPLFKYLLWCSKSKPHFIHCSIDLLKENYFLKLSALNLPFRVFTVNNTEDYLACRQQNVKGIFSDNIEILLNCSKNES